MRVLLGYDGSDSAVAAIRALHRAGLPSDAEVLVVSVADVSPPVPRNSDAEAVGGLPRWHDAPIVKRAEALADESRAQAQTFAAEGADLVKSEFPGWKVSHTAFAGSPYLALIEPTEESDLLVVGAQGRSAVARLVMGSVSQNVLSHAACSVRVSRSAGADRKTDATVRIVLGVDGSPGAALAVSAVAARVWPARTEVKVIAVLDAKFWTALANPQASAWAWVTAPGEEGHSWACEAVEAVASELRKQGLEATPLVESGDPKRVLLDEAERWNADCIFVGAKGHGRVERFLIGSVSAAVAARARCSVEVVRQG
jgi:nucleotide-binding universal stress UspA family protein